MNRILKIILDEKKFTWFELFIISLFGATFTVVAVFLILDYLDAIACINIM